MSTNTQTQTNTAFSGIPSSDNNLKVYELTTGQYAKIAHSLSYLANKAKRTNSWFALKHFESDGKVYVIFSLDENAANHMLSNGKDVPIKILGRLHKLGKRTDETPNQVKDRFTVSFLTTDKSKGREMSQIISKDLQGSQIGEVACSACGRRQKNRTQLWAVKKMGNDRFDQLTNQKHEYSYLGSECVKQGFLGTDISMQTLVSIIQRINEIENVLEQAPAKPTTQVYRSFDVQLNKVLKDGYKTFAYKLDQTAQVYDYTRTIFKVPSYNVNMYKFPSADKDKNPIYNILLNNYSSISMNELSGQRSNYYMDVINSIDVYAVYAFINSNNDTLNAFLDDKFNNINAKLVQVLKPYQPLYAKLMEQYNNVQKKYTNLVSNYQLDVDSLNQQNKDFNVDDEYPEQLYLQNALATIKSNRDLNNATMRNAREIVMSTQENKLFVPTLIPKMRSYVRSALETVNKQLLEEYQSSNQQEVTIDSINAKYDQEFADIQVSMDKIVKPAQQAGQELHSKILAILNEVADVYIEEKKKQEAENQRLREEAEQKMKDDPMHYKPFNTTWGGYEFSAVEIQQLRDGKEIIIPWYNYKKGYTQKIKGKLGFYEYNGTRFGFHVTDWHPSRTK